MNLANGKLTVIKVAKPNQDMRFDVPVVGVPTIENMIEAGATCLSVTPDKTLIFDREEMLKLANENKICVIGSRRNKLKPTNVKLTKLTLNCGNVSNKVKM